MSPSRIQANKKKTQNLCSLHAPTSSCRAARSATWEESAPTFASTCKFTLGIGVLVGQITGPFQKKHVGRKMENSYILGWKRSLHIFFFTGLPVKTLLKRPMEDLDFAVPRKRFCELWWDNKTSGCDVQELVRLQLYLRISLRQGKVCYAKMSVFAAHSMIRPWSPSNAPWKRDAGLTCHAPGCCILILFALNETSG